MLSEGDKAPDFALPDQNGDEVKLSDLSGQTVVIYCYPVPTPRSTASARISPALPEKLEG